MYIIVVTTERNVTELPVHVRVVTVTPRSLPLPTRVTAEIVIDVTVREPNLDRQKNHNYTEETHIVLLLRR